MCSAADKGQKATPVCHSKKDGAKAKARATRVELNNKIVEEVRCQSGKNTQSLWCDEEHEPMIEEYVDRVNCQGKTANK